MFHRAPLLLLPLLLAGCGQQPDPHLYVMSPVPEAQSDADGEAEPVVAVLRVRLPEYLDRPQLVSRNGTNSLEIDDDNRWGEPLDTSVLRVLAENLSHYLPNARVVVPQEARAQKVRYEYLVALDAYEADGQGNAVMRGRWHLNDTRNGKVIADGRIDQQRHLASPTPAAVVGAMNENLNDASRQIAEATARDVGQ